MSQELRNCEMEIQQAIRNIKLDPTTFKGDVETCLDSAVQFFSDHLKKGRFLFHRGRYAEAIEELEKVHFML